MTLKAATGVSMSRTTKETAAVGVSSFVAVFASSLIVGALFAAVMAK